MELMSVYENRLLLTEVDKLDRLWGYYQNEDTVKLLETAKDLETTYPFILPAVEAHIERISTEGNLGRPIESLIEIMKDLETDQFAPIFKEFCERESIYGFGDLQVKELLNDLLKGNNN